MKKRVLIALFLVAGAFSALAELPPLIDRELFFGDPEITGAQLSPDGKYLAFIKPNNGTRNVWVKKTDEPFASARPLTSETKRPIPGYFWTNDGKAILYVQDQGGDENFNIYAVDPAGKAAIRNLTDVKGVRAYIYAAPETQPDIIYAGFNDRDKAWHDLYRVKISTGERELVRKNTDRVSVWIFDLKGNLRLATRSAENGDTEILRVDGDKLVPIYTCDVFETCGVSRFHKDDKRFYLQTNKGAVEHTQLVLMDPVSGKQEVVASDPLKRADLAAVMSSDATDDVVGVGYEDDKKRYVWFDKSVEDDYKFLKSKFPGLEINAVSSTEDERLWLIVAYGDTEPGASYLFDRDTKKLTLQYTIREGLKREYLASMTPIRYKSSDGMEIPAYLTLPRGVEPKNLPLIVIPHGGPWGRDSWGYSTLAQFFANRGYAVLQPNFRASVGLGKKLLDAGNLEWGGKMQDDLTWGVKHLVAQGIVDPKRAGILGGSYGGYAALAGLAFTPDFWAVGVSIVGPSNLTTLLESIPPYWEPIRKLFYKRMGDPNTKEGKALLDRVSPLYSADKIKKPLLVIHGANDPRVKKAEADQIVIALRDRGYPVEYIVAPDEGHGFQRPVNNMAAFAAAERFLAKHLGGRHQATMTPDSEKRLAEIIVDPKTVVLQKAVAAASGTPKPAHELNTKAAKYKSTIAMGTQNMNIEATSTVEDEGANWVFVDTAKTPMGDVTDRVTVSKATLAPVKRAVRQGPVAVDLDFANNKAVGSMSMGGQPKPIDIDTGGPIFADGAGASRVIAALPLANGYTTTYRNFDVQSQKTKTMQLTTSEEGANWKVDVKPADGEAGAMTLWIDKASRTMVKSTAAMPGGMTITTELVL
ncbi:MAG TPA: S9 family peptidase [Thermoanaerobaculia bacterium]|nr:S9 family peptidase [Thermoanaerobaculia bacterium]